MTEARDRVRYVLAQPVVAPAGKIYNYSGSATALLSAILQKASGKPLDALATEALFDPLGIADVEWVGYPDGSVVAASGLRLRPRDLAKVGQLVLANGAWQGEEIVPATWIAESTTPRINGDGLFFYGFQWWLGRSLVERRAVAWTAGVGWGGQRLYIVPSHDMVVLVMAGLYRTPMFQGIVGGTLLNRYALPAAAKP